MDNEIRLRWTVAGFGLRCLLVGALLAAVGCGGGGMKVEGDVTLDGRPLDDGSISFEPADGKGPDFGGGIAAGKYRLTSPPGVPDGSKIVKIRGSRKTGKKIPAGPPHPPNATIDEVIYTPKEYGERSRLTATLERGKANKHEWALVSTPER